MLSSSEVKMPTSLPHCSRPLPLELNCEIFKCLKLRCQRKFIWGLGRGIYGICRQQLLIKNKMLGNPKGNRWDASKLKAISGSSSVTMSTDGLKACNNTRKWQYLFAEKGFDITGEHCRREEEFPGTILHYFEVTKSVTNDWFYVGFSNGNPNDLWFESADLHAFEISGGGCSVSGKVHPFVWPNGVRKPKLNGTADVVGCGLLLNPNNKLFIFFTVNGILMGRKIPIMPSVSVLFPTVRMCSMVSVETNFGDNLVGKPFKFDIAKCAALELE